MDLHIGMVISSHLPLLVDEPPRGGWPPTDPDEPVEPPTPGFELDTPTDESDSTSSISRLRIRYMTNEHVVRRVVFPIVTNPVLSYRSTILLAASLRPETHNIEMILVIR